MGLLVAVLLPCQIALPGLGRLAGLLILVLVGFAGRYLARRFGLPRPGVVGWVGAIATFCLGSLSLLGMDAMSILVGRYPPEGVLGLLYLGYALTLPAATYAAVAVLAAPGIRPGTRFPAPILVPLALLVVAALLPLVPYRTLYATIDDHEVRQLAATGVPLMVPAIEGFTLVAAEANIDQENRLDSSILLKFRGHALGRYQGAQVRGWLGRASDERGCASLRWVATGVTCRQVAEHRWLLT
ncbi:MAG TPA: hypothetical protein VGR21_02295, partial [Cryptosporangiaceae bacterium]|nr:hypothetical protein [Cryptosporangiaceae bacterium]